MKKTKIYFLLLIMYLSTGIIKAQTNHMSVVINPTPNPTVISLEPSNTTTVPLTYYADPFANCFGVMAAGTSFNMTGTLTDINNTSNTYTFQIKPDDNISSYNEYAFNYFFWM